ncbi:MAG: MATE family efflux transporter [Clostridia bacterium]|nr:MATE family efflux transporter [Clostridia bacterium]
MNKRDMTQGNPTKLIAMFALPMLVGSIFQQMYSMVDSIIVGKFVSVDAFAAVGATGSVLYMMIAVIIGFTVGMAVTTSQFVGAKDESKVRDAVGMAMLISVCLSATLAVLGNIFAGSILRLLDTPAEIFDNARKYLMINFASSIGPISYNMFSQIIRASGDSKNPLIALIISSVMNIILDLVFVLAFDMGVGGVALATGISQFISALYCIVVIRKKLPQYWCRRENIRFHGHIFKRICKIGIPMAIQSLFTSFGSMFVQRIVNGLGAVAVAGYTAAIKLNDLALQGVSTLGEALSVYSGQNTGAKKPERVRMGVRSGLKLGIVLSLVFTLLVWFAGPYMVRLFVDTSEAGIQDVIDIAVEFLRRVSPFYIVGCIMYIFTNTLRGMGRVTVPTAASFVELGMKTLAAFVFSSFFTRSEIWFAWPVGYASAVVLLVTYYVYAVVKPVKAE